MQQQQPVSYQYPECGPWGITMSDQLRTASRLNTTFSQRSWADAKQDGCLPPPCGKYPSWPPPRNDGFVYPTMQKKPQELLTLGESNAGFEQPWARQAPRQSSGSQHQFWEAGQSPNGCPLGQGIGAHDDLVWSPPQAFGVVGVGGGTNGGGAFSSSSPNDNGVVYRDLSFEVASKLANEFLSQPQGQQQQQQQQAALANYASQQCQSWNQKNVPAMQ